MNHLLFAILTLSLSSAYAGQNSSKQIDSQAPSTVTSTASSEVWMTSTQANETPLATASSAANEKLVAECKAFIKRMRACYDKMPPDLAGPIKATLEQTKKDLVDANGQTCKVLFQEFSTTAAALQCE